MLSFLTAFLSLIIAALLIVFFVFIIGKYLNSKKMFIVETVDAEPGMVVDENGLADMIMLKWYKDLKFYITNSNSKSDLMYCSSTMMEFETRFYCMPGSSDLMQDLIDTYDTVKNKVVE